jgi:hypothetical protein
MQTKNGGNGNIKHKKEKRSIDRLANDALSYLVNSFVFVKKTRVRTWQAIFIVAFAGGALAAIVLAVLLNIHVTSKAVGETATLSLSPNVKSVEKDGTFDIKALLNTNGSSAVAAKAVINYDKAVFSLLNWNTASSAFAAGNTCVYSGKPCEIITNDPTNGKIIVTLAKPAPGVNTSSGELATLTFKAIKEATPLSNNIAISYVAAGNYTDSDVMLNQPGTTATTDILNSVVNARITVTPQSCTSFTYSEWASCQSNGTQSRTITSSYPAGCAGGSPVLTQPCIYNPPSCTSFTYSAWGICQADGTQTRTIISSTPSGCAGGSPILSQSCSPILPCTSFTYSTWSNCSNGLQTRSIVNSSPASCTGGNPVLSRVCGTGKK